MIAEVVVDVDTARIVRKLVPVAQETELKIVNEQLQLALKIKARNKAVNSPAARLSQDVIGAQNRLWAVSGTSNALGKNFKKTADMRREIFARMSAWCADPTRV